MMALQVFHCRLTAHRVFDKGQPSCWMRSAKKSPALATRDDRRLNLDEQSAKDRPRISSPSTFATHIMPVQGFPLGRRVHSIRVSRHSSILSGPPYSMNRATRSICRRKRRLPTGRFPFESSQCQGSTMSIATVYQHVGPAAIGTHRYPRME